MIYDQNQIDELKQVSPELSFTEDGGRTFFLLKNFSLPEGCTPENMDLLLCPNPRNGYMSLLYFETKPAGIIPSLNWNGTMHLFSKNWYCFSWQSNPGHTLLQMLRLHLNALKP